MLCEVPAVAALALILSVLLPVDKESAKKYLFPITLFNKIADPIRRKILSTFADKVSLKNKTLDLGDTVKGIKGPVNLHMFNSFVHNIGSTLRRVGEYDFNRRDGGFLFEMTIEAFNLKITSEGILTVLGMTIKLDIVVTTSHMVSKIEAFYAKGAVLPVFEKVKSSKLENLKTEIKTGNFLIQAMINKMNKEINEVVRASFDERTRIKLTEAFGEGWWGEVMRNTCKVLSIPIDMLLSYARTQICTNKRSAFPFYDIQHLDYVELTPNMNQVSQVNNTSQAVALGVENEDLKMTGH